MRHIIKFEGDVIGQVLSNHSMTPEEICEMAGVELAITQDDYEHSPENGKYIMDCLEFVSK